MSPCLNVICSLSASALALADRSMSGRGVQGDDVVTFASERDREAAGATGELEDRPACTACKVAVKRFAWPVRTTKS
jgi:hypothetical protein